MVDTSTHGSSNFAEDASVIATHGPEFSALNSLLGDRYQLIRPLRQAVGRQTLLAVETATSRQVVIKLLTFGDELSWEDIKLFEREAQTLESLEHPAIPDYIETFEFQNGDRRSLAIVQEAIDATSLEEHIQAGRLFSEVELRQIALKLLEILVYLHQQSPLVIHRDIKPSNILLVSDSVSENVGPGDLGPVYLVDFGSVQATTAQSRGTMTVVGTYGYNMPPEQFGGRTVPASDLYALGATLIFLATRQHPVELLQDDLRLPVEAIARLSKAFKQWLQQLIEPALDQRFAKAEGALTALTALNPIPQLDSLKQGEVLLKKLSKSAWLSSIEGQLQDDALVLAIPRRQVVCVTAKKRTSRSLDKPAPSFFELTLEVRLALGLLQLLLVSLLLLTQHLIFLLPATVAIGFGVFAHYDQTRKKKRAKPGQLDYSRSDEKLSLQLGLDTVTVDSEEEGNYWEWPRSHAWKVVQKPGSFGDIVKCGVFSQSQATFF